MKSKKLFITLMFIMLLAFASVPTQAATSTKARALQTYKTFLQSRQSRISWFATAQINKDSIPELIVRNYNGYNRVYTYANGGLFQLGVDSGIRSLSGYYKKKGVIASSYAHGNMYGHLSTNTYFLKITNGTLRKIAPNISTYKYKNNPTKTTYYSNYTKISKSKYKSLLKKSVGSTKQSKFTYRRNTAAIRAKYL